MKKIKSPYKDWVQEMNKAFVKAPVHKKHSRNYLEWLKSEVKRSSLPSTEKRAVLDLFFQNPKAFIDERVKIYPKNIIKEFEKKAKIRKQGKYSNLIRVS